MANLKTQHFGYQEEQLYVFRETFTGNGVSTTFQLTGNVGNATFETGAWLVDNVETTMAADVSKTNRAALYDSVLPLVRNKISVSSISASGLVTLDYAPMAENFYIWYWYDLQGDALEDYYRDDFVNSLEADAGVTIASGITTDTSGFGGLLDSNDDTVQKALDSLDDLTISSDYGVTGLVTAGNIKINTSQDLQAAASPSFVRATLTQAIGTAPLTITSTTVCTNLNADLWDGYQFADYLDQAVKQASSPTFVTVKLSGLTDGYIPYHVADATGLANSALYTDGTDFRIFAASGGTYNANWYFAWSDQSPVLYMRSGTTTRGVLAFDAGGGDVILAASGTTDVSNLTLRAEQYIYFCDNAGGGGSYPIMGTLEVATGNLTLVGSLQSTTALLTNLTDGYVPYHVSDTAGLANTNIYYSSSKVGIGLTSLTYTLEVATSARVYNASAAATLYVQGAGSAATAANVVLQSDYVDVADYRGAGVFFMQTTSQKEWFFGQPYASADQLIIARVSSIATHSMDTAQVSNALVYISPLGHLGIGVSPSYTLHTQELAADNNFYMDVYSDNNGHSGYLVGRRSHQDTAGLTATTTNSYLLVLEGWGVNSGGPARAKAVQVRFEQDGSTGATYVPGRIVWFTGTAAAATAEKMRLTSAGYLGIGCTPVANLEVEDGGTAASMLVKITQDDANPYALVIGNDTYSTTDTSGFGIYVGNTGIVYFHSGVSASDTPTATYWNTSALILGKTDTQYAYLQLSGHATGSTQGGMLYLDTAADHDTTIGYYLIQVSSDDLYIGPSTDTDALKLTDAGDLLITAGTIACADLTDQYLPYHVSDTAGLANSYVTHVAGSYTGFTGNVAHGSSGGYAQFTGLMYPGVEGQLSYPVIGGFMTNLLSNYADRGGTITITDAGGCTTSNTSYAFESGSGVRGFPYIACAEGATSTWEMTGVSLPVPSHATYAPFIIMRGPSYTSSITNIKVEYRGSDNTTWYTIHNAAPTWSGYSGYADTWRGSYSAFAAYPITGVRWTFTLTGTATIYFAELGLWNKNAVLGAFSVPRCETSNIFGASQMITGNLMIGSSTATTVARLEVEDGATAASILVKITQDDNNVYGLVIGNDAYSTTDTLGLRFSVTEAGSCVMEASSANDLYIRARGTANASDMYIEAEDKIYIDDFNGATPLTQFTLDVINAILYIGSDDLRYGRLYIRGQATGSAQGGLMYLDTAADHDGTITSFSIQAYEDDLLIGPSTDTDALKLTSDKDLLITSGTIACSDLTDGYVPYHVSDTAGLANSIISVTANDITVAGDIKLTAAKKLYLDTGGDTYIHEVSADKVEVFVGGVELITLIETTQDEVRINEDGADVDFTVEASGVADALIVQGSDGQITLGALTAGFVKSSAAGVLSVDTATYVNYTLFDAHTVLYATADNTPLALTVTEQTLVGRLTGGNISAVAIGIADNNIVQIDQADAADNDYVKFTANGVEGRSYAEVLADLSGQATGAFNFNTQAVTVGSLLVGADDTTAGVITSYGGGAGADGGVLKLYLGADDDASIAYFAVQVVEDDLLIGPDTDTDALKLTSGKDLYLTDGDLFIQNAGTTLCSFSATYASLSIGSADTVYGNLYLYGHAAGSVYGGNFQIFLAADHDTSIDYFVIRAYEDDLEIGPNTNSDALTLTSDFDLRITSGTVSCYDLTDGYVPYHVSDAAGLANSIISVTSSVVTIGTGAAGVDYALTFNGADSDGTLTWMEDEVYFKTSSPLYVNGDNGEDYPNVLILRGGTDKAAAGPALKWLAGYDVADWVLAYTWAQSDGYGVDWSSSMNWSVADTAGALQTSMKLKIVSSAALLYIGQNDALPGIISMYGAGAGSTSGGGFTCYTAADHDTTIDYYSFRVLEDYMQIGPSTDEDALKLDANKDFYITAGDLHVEGGGIYITELAAAQADIAGKGQLWVKNSTPNELWFTDDAGTDHQIAFV